MVLSSLLNYPAGAAHMVDHLIQGILVSFGKALRNGVSRILEVRAIIGSSSNGAECGPSRGDDIVELVVCEEKGAQVDSGVGLEPSFSRKLMILWCFFMKAALRTTG